MGALVWLDAPLLVLGLLALSPWMWHCYRRRGAIRKTSLSRGPRRATTLLCCLGFVSLAMAGIDVALAEWDKTHLPRDDRRAASILVSDDTDAEPRMALDFRLPSLEGGGPIRLSDYRGRKPVVLIFGSFS